MNPLERLLADLNLNAPKLPPVKSLLDLIAPPPLPPDALARLVERHRSERTSLASLLSSLPSPPQPPNLADLARFLYNTPPPPPVPQWIGVRRRFEEFNRNLLLTPTQLQDGMTKRNGVVSCLNRHYYGTGSETANSFLIGSWGKNTMSRPPRDVDLYFVLPYGVYQRFEQRTGNKQSDLLQEVKAVLAKTYSTTAMRGDGQVVVVGFGESFNVEVVPAIRLTNGQYWICDTNNGGQYKPSNPKNEIAYIELCDQNTNRNLRTLIRMLKAWQKHCSVPVKSFELERLASEFLTRSPWRFKDFFWFDWIVRDFFYDVLQKPTNILGTLLGYGWGTMAQTAYDRAVRACIFEGKNQVEAAGEEWQKIFGFQIPRNP